MQAHPWVASARLEPAAFRGRWWRASSNTGRRRWSSSARSTSSTTRAACSSAPRRRSRWIFPSSPGCARDLAGIKEAQLRLFSALHLLDTWQAGASRSAPLRGAPRRGRRLHPVRAGWRRRPAPWAPAGASGGSASARGDLSLKLKRLAQVRAALARRGEQAARIDLDNPARPDQAAATLADTR